MNALLGIVGVRQNLEKGKPLPPGIAKRSLPPRCVDLLPHHQDYDWMMAGLDLVLISKADKMVREIYRDAFK